MKKDVIRIVCFLLTVLLVGSLFVGCGEDEPAESPTDVVNSVVSTPDPVIITTDENDPYEIKQDKDGKDIAILVPEDDGTITLEVAEKTTVEAFLACAVAKEGYAARLTDAKGEEVTDAKALMATGMVFAVVKDGEDEATVSFPIRVISQEAIDNKVDQQQQVESQINQQNPSSQGGTNNSAGNDEDSNAVTSKITLKTVWGSKYTESSAMGKAWQATLENTKKHQKIATDIGSIDPNSAVDLIVKDVMAGKSSVDIYEVSLSMCRNIAKNKAAANLFESKTLNRANVKNGGTDAVTFNNKCYGVALNGTAGAATGIIYNKDLIKKYAPTYDLQALYKANKWDFDAFRTVAKLCTQDTDGDGKTDIYGVTSNTNLIGQAITSNAGGTALMKNGRVEATMCNSNGVRALEFCKELFKTDRSWKYFADIKDSINFFCAGTSAMFASNLHFYTEIATKADFKLDYVHTPMGSDQNKYIDAVYDASLYMVPKTKEKQLDVIGNWINSIASISGKALNNESKKMTMNGLSDDAVNTYKWIMNNVQADYSTGAFSGTISSAVDGSVTTASKSPAKVMDSIKTQAQKELDDFYANMY